MTASDANDAVVDAPASAGHPPLVREPKSRYSRWRHRYVTPQAIYGTLLVAAVIGTAVDDDTDFEVLVKTVVTVTVFWITHIAADGIAHYCRPGSDGQPLTESLKHAVTHSSGLLWAAVVPALLLLTAVVHLVDEDTAYALALVFPVVVLAVLGWMAVADRGSSLPARFVGGFVTGFLGVIVILLKIVFH